MLKTTSSPTWPEATACEASWAVCTVTGAASPLRTDRMTSPTRSLPAAGPVAFTLRTTGTGSTLMPAVRRAAALASCCAVARAAAVSSSISWAVDPAGYTADTGMASWSGDQ